MSWIQDIPDDILLAGLKDGDSVIFEGLFYGTYNTVRFYAHKFLGQAPCLDEIADDTFMEVWRNRGRFESIEHLRRFIFSVTRNACISRLRKEKALEAAMDEISFIPFSEDEQPDLDLVHTEIMEMIFSSIDDLPPAYGKILRQTVLEEKPHSEIAADMSITPNLVTVKKFRALTLVRSRLSQLGVSF